MSVDLYEGDAFAVLSDLTEAGMQFDSCITDPPYYLESIVKRFGRKQAAAKHGSDGRFSRLSADFMGKRWDGSDGGYKIAHDPDFWRLVYDLLKPGAFALAFSSPMTGHRQACAMEDAGFRMHPFILWTYGTGWPKAHAVTKFAPEALEWQGWYYSTQTLKPAVEPIYMAQKPYSEKTGFANVLKHGVGAVNIDACRTEGGNWPANLILEEGSTEGTGIPNGGSYFNRVLYFNKANESDRGGIDHPTVKPVALLRHLVRLVTPRGGSVLDPFAGTGTTAQAALDEGMISCLVESDQTYCDGIRRRFGIGGGSLENYFRALGI